MIDFIILDTIIFAITQNGNLSCINQFSGEVLWKKKIIPGDFVTGGGNIEIYGDSNIIIATSNRIKKYSTEGELINEQQEEL